MVKRATTVDVLGGLSELEQLRIVTLQEGGRLSSLSADSILRNHRDKVIDLGPRRLGIRVRDALTLRNKKP